jgi:hypothetical protein
MLNLAYPMPMTFIVALIVTILGVIIGSLSGSVAGEPEAGMQNNTLSQLFTNTRHLRENLPRHTFSLKSLQNGRMAISHKGVYEPGDTLTYVGQSLQSCLTD